MPVTLSKLILSCCSSNDRGDHGWQRPQVPAASVCPSPGVWGTSWVPSWSSASFPPSLLPPEDRAQVGSRLRVIHGLIRGTWGTGSCRGVEQDAREVVGPGRPLGWIVSFSGIFPFSVGSFRQLAISSLVCSTFYPSKFSTQMKILKFGGHLGRLGITCM